MESLLGGGWTTLDIVVVDNDAMYEASERLKKAN